MVVDVTRVEYTTLNVVESKIYRYPFVVPAYIRLPVLFHDIADTVNGLYIYQSSSARAKYIIFFFLTVMTAPLLLGNPKKVLSYARAR